VKYQTHPFFWGPVRLAGDVTGIFILQNSSARCENARKSGFAAEKGQSLIKLGLLDFFYKKKADL